MNTKNTMAIQPRLKNAAGIDVHQSKIVVCYYSEGHPEQVKEYETFTCDLETIRDDLKQLAIEEVIMESTGIYWLALCQLLMSANIRVTVVNPYFVKNMPKEKTNRKDARWLCKLLVNGLVRNSFIVDDVQRAFRDLCRQRSRYTNHITQTKNRIVKQLERRNIKLKSVVSSMSAKSAMDIVSAIADGETDIEKLVALCRGKLKKKKDLMRKALQGILTAHDREMLQMLLQDITHYESQLQIIEQKITQHTDKVNQQLIERLQQIKGVGKQSTEIILAEIGDNVDKFSTADKLTAWVGVAPGNKESAGVKKYSGTRDGNVYLRTAIVQVAWAAVRTKDSYWKALFAHLRKRMHHNKAIIVIARKLVKVIYKVIKGMVYQEYGAAFFIEKLMQRKGYATLSPQSLPHSK